MGRKVMMIFALSVLLCTRVARVTSDVDCNAVASLVSSCSSFITHGAPQPSIGSACCHSVVSLDGMADSTQNRRSVCRCLMSLVASYNPNPTALASLPGICGIPDLGFSIPSVVDCNTLGGTGWSGFLEMDEE
ncbi:hypothetical protein ACLOJK_006177 [Asimina triloba]